MVRTDRTVKMKLVLRPELAEMVQREARARAAAKLYTRPKTAEVLEEIIEQWVDRLEGRRP